ncbi:hypothetical protein Tco_1288442, partial [Tanacetum coccineum]
MLKRCGMRKRDITPNTNKSPNLRSDVTFKENMVRGFHVAITRRTRNRRDKNVNKRKKYGGGGGSPHPTWLRHRPRHHTTTARHSKKPNGGDLSDVDDFGDLEMIMQQVQAEQEEEEAKR